MTRKPAPTKAPVNRQLPGQQPDSLMQRAGPVRDVPTEDTTTTPPPLAPAAQSPERAAFGYPSRSTIARWVLVLLALYGVGWLLWTARPALTPFIIGLVLAYLLTPLVNWLCRWMRRPFAILLVYLGAAVLGVAAVAFIVPPVIDQVRQLISSFPSINQIETTGDSLLRQYNLNVPEAIREPLNTAVNNALRTLQTNFGAYVQGLGGFLANQVLEIINTITFLIGFLIIPIWLFYVLNDQNEGKAYLDRMLHPRLRPDFWNVWEIINKVFSNYIRGQLILGLAVAAMVAVGLLILQLIGFDIRYILLLSIIAGITELIPIIGPVIGAIPAVVIAFFSESDPVRSGLAVLVLYIIVQQIENNVLVPRIVGESVGVHPAILTVVLIAMGQVFGLLGVILSAPLSAISRDLFLYIYRRLGGQSPSSSINIINNQDKSQTDLNAINEPEPA